MPVEIFALYLGRKYNRLPLGVATRNILRVQKAAKPAFLPSGEDGFLGQRPKPSESIQVS